METHIHVYIYLYIYIYSSSLVCVCMNQSYGSSVHLQSARELSSLFTQVSLWRLSAICVNWQIQKFWCIICLCSVIIEGANALYTFILVSMFWLGQLLTHTWDFKLIIIMNKLKGLEVSPLTSTLTSALTLQSTLTSAITLKWLLTSTLAEDEAWISVFLIFQWNWMGGLWVNNLEYLGNYE